MLFFLLYINFNEGGQNPVLIVFHTIFLFFKEEVYDYLQK